MSSHPSCPGVEKYPNFGPEKMVHMTHAPPLSACSVGTVACLLVWHMYSFHSVCLCDSRSRGRACWGVLSRKFPNVLTSQLSQIQERCLPRSLCPPLSSYFLGCVTLSLDNEGSCRVPMDRQLRRAWRLRPACPCWVSQMEPFLFSVLLPKINHTVQLCNEIQAPMAQ